MLTTAPPPQYEDDIDLLRYGRFLASYWLLLLACALGGAILGLVLAARAPVMYQAAATLSVIPPTPGSAITLTPATSRTLIANLTLVSETLTEVGLDRVGVTPQGFVEDSLVVQPVPNTNLVRLSVSLPDAAKAQMAVEVLSKKAVALGRRLEAEGSVAARDALKVQMEEAGRRLGEAQERLLAFQTRSQVDLRAAGTLSSLFQRNAGVNAGIEREFGTLKYEIGSGRAGGSRGGVSQGPISAQPADTPAGKQFAELYRVLLELKRHEAEYEASENVYIRAAERYGDASGRVVGSIPPLQMVEGPLRPERPIPRRRVQYVMFGGLLGLLAGVAAALVLNHRRSFAAS